MSSNTQPLATPDRLALAGLSLLMLISAVCTLDRQSLWLDELGAWDLTITTSWGDLVGLLRDPRAGYPLYHVVLRLWITVFGDSAWAMRALSVLCGVGAALLTARTARMLGRSPVLAMLLQVIAPFPLHYAQEVTAYSALMLWGAAWLWALLRFLGGRRGSLLVLVILAVIGTALHRVAAFAVAGAVLAGLVVAASSPQRQPLLLAIAPITACAVAGAIAAYASYAVPLLAVERAGLIQALWLTMWRFALDQGPSWAGLPALLPPALLFGWGAGDLIRRSVADRTVRFLLLAVALPLALFLIQLIWTGRYEARYLAALYPAWALISAPSLAFAHRTGARALMVAALVAQLLVNSAPGGPWGALPTREQYREALTTLLRTLHPDDRLLIYPPYLASAWRYYAPRIAPATPHLPVVAADDLPPAWPGQREFLVVATIHAQIAARTDPNAPSLADPPGTIPCGTQQFHGVTIRCRIVAQPPARPARPIVALFGERLVLRDLAFELPPAGLGPGDSLPIRLTWDTLGPTDADRFVLSLRHIGATAPLVVADAPLLGGAINAWEWLPGHTLTDRRTVTLRDHQDRPLPPGRYRLSLTVGAGERALLATSPGREPSADLTLAILSVGAGAGPPSCLGRGPDGCGQVRIADNQLFDQRGIWVPQGVQFFLPAHGINERSFWDDRYAAAVADGTLDRWLDRAALRLHPNLLRIFVELPFWENDQLITPTSPATVVDFAERAAQRGMRLGIVLHNSADWKLTPERQAWIEALISAFLEAGALERIAYLNSDNEINNHCLPARQRDCFALEAAYREGAIAWAHSFSAIVKARSPQLLVTVGMATELASGSQPGGAANYFRPDRGGRTLAQAADLLAPHNYAGRGAAILAEIRTAGYSGPVILEEYGFPTDPAPQQARWSEGPPTCRRDPFRPECVETAPYYVELNLQALRAGGYAGGVAWMLADTLEKDQPGACTSAALPFDLWTGLLAAGTSYCAGGTGTRMEGAPKATALRVCAYHTSNLDLCLADAIQLRVP